MKGSVRKRGCTCEKTKRCTCGAKWYYVVDTGINPATGDRRQTSKSGFDTKALAWDACHAVINELKQGTFVHEANTLFKDFADEWLANYQKKHKVKISSLRVRKHELSLLTPYFAHYKMKDISRKRYQDALNDLKDKGYADNTITGVHVAGRMVFKAAIEYGIIRRDPSQFAKVPRLQKTVEELEAEKDVPKYLEKEELAIFLKAAQEHGLDRDYTTFLVLAYTGIRCGELCALKWKDIDFTEQTISIMRTYCNLDNKAGDYILLTPKTKASKRVIEVDSKVLAELEKHRAAQNLMKMRLRKTYQDNDFIFTQYAKYPGCPVRLQNVEQRMLRLLKRACLDTSLSPHSLRHTHTSLLAEAGVGLPQIMARLGHQDDQTTRNIYLHCTKTMSREASQKFSELMKKL